MFNTEKSLSLLEFRPIENALLFERAYISVALLTVALSLFTLVAAHYALRNNGDWKNSFLENFKSKPLLLIPCAILTLLGGLCARVLYKKSGQVLRIKYEIEMKTKYIFSGDYSRRIGLEATLKENEFFLMRSESDDNQIEMIFNTSAGGCQYGEISLLEPGVKERLEWVREKYGLTHQMVPNEDF